MSSRSYEQAAAKNIVLIWQISGTFTLELHLNI
jgi:hypothetical protein